MSDRLPIHAVLPDLLQALERDGAAVLIAPPGAGKTTAIAPVLIRQEWCKGQVILLSPRRVAARGAAERMAEMLGEKTGETVGYLTRLDSRQSAKTRILVMTEAIFVNRIIEDAELSGVSAVLFDEAHERHLDSDLGLALALESKAVLREDLRICVMSATIDGQLFAGLFGAHLLGDDAPVVESEGTAHPLRIEWLGARAEQRIEDQMVRAILTAWRDESGDVLVFLPGVREIERVREGLLAKLPETLILPLHGQVEPAAQRAAIKRDPDGRRRIVLATAIAETSLTLDGVRIVVDSGLSRRAEFDSVSGTTRLVTHRASQAASAQRAGRAARQGPGVAYRIWEEGGHGGRPRFDPPEMETADLAPMVLALAKWGTGDIASLAWLNPPPDASIASAKDRLQKLGALTADGAITPKGRDIASLPLDPVMASAILAGAEAGQAQDAARMALLTQERGLGGGGEDLLQRLSRWGGDRSAKAKAAGQLAGRWAKLAERLVGSEKSGPDRNGGLNPAIFLALAMPDNVARCRSNSGSSSGENWVSAGGRGYFLDPASPLARAQWLVIADAQGQAKSARITAAAELDPSEVEEHLGHLIKRQTTLRWNDKDARMEARLERRMGAITLSSGPDPSPDPAAFAGALFEFARGRLGQLIPPELLARGNFAQIEALSLSSLQHSAEIWLAPLLEGRRDIDIPAGKITGAILDQLDWQDRQRLDQEAPSHFTSPAGTSHRIDYIGEGAPSAELRVQALFGLDRHPMIGNVPLQLSLTSPAGRPIQTTRDLPNFWRGSWQDVAKEMKGRYPRHRWPEQPWTEKPSLKTKNAFSKSGG